MSLISSFFFSLSLYFITLLLSTICRKFITYKGIFYIFVFFLSALLLYLMSLFTNIVVFGAFSDFVWVFNTISWLSVDLSISLKLDVLSYFFVLLVVAIGLGTNIYTLNYMKFEANEDIFALLINWFMFSMIVLVLGNNLFTLFLGWESIGLSSFFLINFWSTRRGTVKSSFKAFFFNKISDVFLFIFLIVVNSTLYLNDLSALNLNFFLNFNNTGMMQLGAICLFVCTLFKSAQLLGHLWLPDSMEAPVPASALIHSATLVSAGVYLLLRFSPLISNYNLQYFALVIGSLTAAYGAIVSASQTDMKKLLAYSTISHCGFLFVTIGTEIYVTSLVYLFLHGLFKALTFFCAGSFIRVAGSQDTRSMGALSRVIPVDTVFLLICAFNLGGMPFSLGYLYKSLLMSSVLSSSSGFCILGLCTIGLCSSLIYVYRLVYYSAFDVSKEFFSTLIYDMQQKQINIVSRWSLTTIVQILAVLILLCFTVWVYVFFSGYFLSSDLFLDYLPISLNSNSLLVFNSNLFYKAYYEVFYSIYLVIFFVLVLMSWRVEYTYLYKFNFISFLTQFMLFVVIFSFILN